MKRFEVGKHYGTFDSGLDPVKVIKRTAKFITVRNPMGNEWRMKIRECEGKNGCRFEIAFESRISTKWREALTYSAMLEE